MSPRRICPGLYRLTHEGRQVEIRKESIGWLAIADWDVFLVSDPVSTYREARAIALDMIRSKR